MRWIRCLSLALLLAGCASCGASTTPASEPSASEPSAEAQGEPHAAPSQAPGAQEAEPLAEPPPASADDVRAFGRASNAFALDLWQRIRADAPPNAAISPASVSMALAMTYAGARGETASQMASVLHFDGFEGDALHRAAGNLLAAWNDPARESYRLAVANRLFGEATYDFEAPFLTLTRELYRAPLEPVDYRTDHEGARGRINGWVAERTEDRIRRLLPPGALTPETRLVLTNAVYFLAEWARPFEPEATRPEPFTVAPERRVTVPTMHQTARFDYAEDDDAQVLQMRYRGGELAMVVVLPRAADGLAALEAGLDPETLDGWLNALAPRRVEVALPKVEIDPPQPIELSDTLGAMGMPLAFDPDAADFTAMADPPRPADRLYISKVFHQAFVAVDEEGTEAAAATAVVMGRAGAAPPAEPPVAFEADHPFLFLIRDLRSGTLLFLGRVAEPSPAEPAAD
jgi:serpin B